MSVPGSGVLFAVALFGGIALSIYPFLRAKEPVAAWSKGAVMLLGSCAICWSLLLDKRAKVRFISPANLLRSSAAHGVGGDIRTTS